jgi:hypothetical protein
MEACGGSHFLGRALREQGHEVRLMPAQYVKPHVKTNKSDYIDAEAIAEGVGRPKMRFVPIKSDEPFLGLARRRSFRPLYPLSRIYTEDQPHRHLVATWQLHNGRGRLRSSVKLPVRLLD